MELVNVFYDDVNKSIVGRKVTGDPNVPCQEVTFQASLTDPVVLPEDSRECLAIESYLNNEHNSVDFANVSATNQRHTTFVRPVDCSTDVNLDEDIFRTKIWQFKCSCQVAYHNFSQPRMICGMFIVFAKDVFGVLFLEEMRTLSIFYKS